jgi:hypothetical protein
MKRGRPPIGEKAMTPVERQRRHRRTALTRPVAFLHPITMEDFIAMLPTEEDWDRLLGSDAVAAWDRTLADPLPLGNACSPTPPMGIGCSRRMVRSLIQA